MNHHHTLLQLTPDLDADFVMTPGGKRLQDLMRSDDVVELVTSPWAPSILRDPTYTDLVVVWDHGEGPNCPTHTPDPSAWRKYHCLPPAVWDYVAEALKSRNLTDSYTWVWLRSEEATPDTYVPGGVVGVGDQTLDLIRRTLTELTVNRDVGTRQRAIDQAAADALAVRVHRLAEQINGVTAMMLKTAWPERSHDPIFGPHAMSRISACSSTRIYAAVSGSLALPKQSDGMMGSERSIHEVRVEIGEPYPVRTPRTERTAIVLSKWPAAPRGEYENPDSVMEFASLAEYVESLHAAIKVRR